MNTQSPHVVFAGGGTGGHLFPGLAVAEQLQALLPAAQITIATGMKAFEHMQVATAGFAHLRLPSHPLTGPTGAWRFIKDNLTGYRRAKRFVRQTDVSLVVGLGGYASVPMAWAAASARIPLVLLEQNAIPGRATRWLAPKAALICTTFEEARRHLNASGPIRMTGNPIRAGFRAQAATVDRDASSQQLLVLGGSGGARTLNEQVPRALYKAQSHLAGWRIVHQTGQRDWKPTTTLYRKLAIPAIVVPFIERIQPVLRQTDLAVCRSGGTTLAELAAAGVPALLLPYPHAADNHQRVNADLFAAAGAAKVLDAREITGRLDSAVASVLTPLLSNAAVRQGMSAAMARVARPDAAWQVATMIQQLLQTQPEPPLLRV